MSKNIVLCSDGTGNRWGAGDQTNVSRIFQAVDTGRGPRQIRFYDNGVGTSSNRYLRAITGAFGFGLKRNVRDLYEFLGRHWQPGDRIYLFGFSRGAATVRAFAGMLQESGLVYVNPEPQGAYPDSKSYDEDRYDQLVDLAMHAYSRRQPAKRKRAARSDREAIEAFHHAVEDSAGGFRLERRVDVKMVGVWDTVPALGFPKGPVLVQWLCRLAEVVSDYLFPHSFYNYQLDDRVEHAVHALAIDDERRSFRPMLFNEKVEPKARPANVEQVWFAGMHSDVGGGYPRDGLSSVSLRWMMAHAERNGLRLRQGAVADARRHANPEGKMHDSRDGGKIFYRYLPRDLVKLCEIGVGRGRASEESMGAIGSVDRWFDSDPSKPPVEAGEVQIHHSVVDRVHSGTARYAPGLLPQTFRVVKNPPVTGPYGPKSKKVEIDGEPWRKYRKRVHKWTFWRSVLYHVFLYLSLGLVIWALNLPAGPASEGADSTPPTGDGVALDGIVDRIGAAFDWLKGWGSFGVLLDRAEAFTSWAGGFIAGLLDGPLPDFAANLVDRLLVRQPIELVMLLTLAAFLFSMRTYIIGRRARAARKMRTRILQAWAAVCGHRHRWDDVAATVPTPGRRPSKVLQHLAALMVVLLFAIGALSLVDREAAGTIVPMVCLPLVAWVVFGILFERIGRPKGEEPLEKRRRGYGVTDVEREWSARKRYLGPERNFLLADLFFPLAYGAAFGSSLLLGGRALGFGAWIVAPVALVVAADWVENFSLLGQLKRFRGGQKPEASVIRIASLATSVKCWSLGIVLVLLLALVLLVAAPWSWYGG